MRAVTGTIASTKPCSTLKASRVLQGFESNAPSAGILSSDAATYLRTAIEAANDLHLFRGYLRLRQLREEGEGGSESKSGRRRRTPPVDEDGREGGGGSEKRHRPAPEGEDGRWEPKVEEEEEYVMTVPASAEKKISERKGSRENVEKQGIAAPPHGDSHSPATEKRRKRKEKPVKDEDEAGDPVKGQSRKSIDSAMKKKKKEKLVKDEDEAGDLVKEQSRTPLDSGKKKKKKKKHLKQEDLGVEEAEEKMVRVGVAEYGMTSEEKRRKNRKHTEVKEVKQEVVDDSDLGSDKKRKKKKRGRDGDNGNDTELVEHTSKKQRK